MNYFKKNLIILMIVVFAIFLVACDEYYIREEKTFDDYQSGDKITLTINNYADFVYLDISKLEPSIQDGSYVGISYKYFCYGYKAFKHSYLKTL